MELDTNAEGYPLLPDNVMDLQLDNKKKVVRKYVGATLGMFIAFTQYPPLSRSHSVLQEAWPHPLGKDCRQSGSFPR